MFEELLKYYPYTNLNYIWLFLKNAKTIRFNKGDIIVKPGILDRNVYLVVNGLIRSYKELGNSKKTLFFRSKYDLFMFHECVLENKKTTSGIEALENVKLLYFSYDLIERYEKKSLSNSLIMNRWLRDMLLIMIRRVEQNVLMTPFERYIQFKEEYPEYYQTLPQKYLASYLGITEESLSRIRKRLTKVRLK